MDMNDQKNQLRKNKIALYIDDNRTPTETPEGYEWKIVRSYKEFTEFIISFYRENKELPSLFSFDHDLTSEYISWYFEYPGEKIIDYSQFKTQSGFHCAVWLINACEKNNVSLENTLFAIHSINEAGADNIKEFLNNYKEKKWGLGKANAFIKYWTFDYDQKAIQKQQKEFNEKTDIPTHLGEYPLTSDECFTSPEAKKDI